MKGTMMRSIAKKILEFGLAGCMAVVGLAGCSQPQAVEQPAAVEEEQPTYDLIIGAEDAAVVNFPMTNGTESVITGLQVKDVASADFSANLMTSSQEWEPGQVADVFFAGVLIADAEDGAADSSAASSAAGAASGAAAASDAADVTALEDLILNASYDLQLTMADGTTAVLHQLNLGSLMNAEDITIAVDAASGAAYLTYVEDDASASTLDAELQLIAEQEAALAAAAEAEAAAAAVTAAQTANQSQSSGSGGGGSYDSVAPSGGSGSGGSAPSQSEDACVAPDDLVFN